MVTSDAVKPVEETPQLRKYLTWLETSEKRVPDAEQTIPPPAIPLAPIAPKPASSPSVPVASAKPAAPERKRKKRTGVKHAPAALPGAASAPPRATPLPSPAAALAKANNAADQVDVELVDSVDPPTPARTDVTTLESSEGGAIQATPSRSTLGAADERSIHAAWIGANAAR